MNNISLLPPEIILSRQSRKSSKKYLLVFMIILMMLLSSYFALLFTNYQASSQLNQLIMEKAEIEVQVEDLSQYRDLQNQLTFVNETFQSIFKNVPDWEGILIDLGLTITEGVWITDINSSDGADTDKPKENTELLIQGAGTSQFLIAKYLEKFKTISNVKNAEIISTGRTTIDNQEVVQFEIKLELVPGIFQVPFPKGASLNE